MISLHISCVTRIPKVSPLQYQQLQIIEAVALKEKELHSFLKQRNLLRYDSIDAFISFAVFSKIGFEGDNFKAFST
jgi:hypothetical protein